MEFILKMCIWNGLSKIMVFKQKMSWLAAALSVENNCKQKIIRVLDKILAFISIDFPIDVIYYPFFLFLFLVIFKI